MSWPDRLILGRKETPFPQDSVIIRATGKMLKRQEMLDMETEDPFGGSDHYPMLLWGLPVNPSEDAVNEHMPANSTI